MRPGPLKGVSKSGREGHSTMGFDHTLIVLVFTIPHFLLLGCCVSFISNMALLEC